MMRIVGWIILLFVSVSAAAQWTLSDDGLATAQIDGVPSNTKGIEFSPAFYKNEIIYIHPGSEGRDREIHERYFEIASAENATDFALINAVKEHIGPVYYDADRSMLYYTQSLRKKRRRKTLVNKIFSAKYEGGQWMPQGQLEIEGTESISIMHPSLSSDGTMMVYAARLKKGLGKYDICYSTWQGDAWSAPLLIGPAVNTIGNEAFPSLYQDSVLLYASDSRDGLGGYDIYASTYHDGRWTEAVNLTELNSSSDDLGLILSAEGTEGFFSSNRSGGKGKDDIYKVNFAQPLFENVATEEEIVLTTQRELYEMRTIVESHDDRTPISDVFVTLIPMSELTVESVKSSDKDGYLMNLIPKSSTDSMTVLTNAAGEGVLEMASDVDYLLTLQKEGYKPYTINLKGSDRVPEITIGMTPEKKVMEINKEEPQPAPSPTPAVEEPKEKVKTYTLTPLSEREVLVFDQIYYEYNSAEITPNSTAQLDLLVAYMKKYDDMRVELIAHTDARGQRDFNQKLSVKRAQAAKAYMVLQGVSDFRIVATGRGEDEVRNHCTSGVYCTEKEHEYNRRTEVKVHYE